MPEAQKNPRWKFVGGTTIRRIQPGLGWSDSRRLSLKSSFGAIWAGKPSCCRFSTISKADVTHEQRSECARATKGAEFLFNQEIDDYCLLLLKQALEFHIQKDPMNLNQDPESDEAKRRQNDHFDRVQWWFEQEQKIPLRFTPFLKVEE